MNKNKIAYSIAIVFFMIAFTACERSDGPAGEKEAIPVELSVDEASGFVTPVSTRGPMNGWFNTEVHMAYGEVPQGDPFTTFNKALNGAVIDGITVFQPLLFYPKSGDEIYLRGFHPREGVTNLTGNDRLITDNKIDYTITGQEDIMISNVVSGSQDVTIASKGGTLKYRHLLTQVSFELKATTGFPATLKVTKIEITGVRTQATLDINPTVNFDDAGCLTFSGATSNLTAYSNPAGLVLSTNSSGEIGHAMFEPKVSFGIKITLSNGDTVEVTNVTYSAQNLLTGKAEREKHYKIFVTLGVEPGFPKVGVDAWVEKTVENGLPEDWW